jgi:uncharacterized protein (DUF983 family)
VIDQVGEGSGWIPALRGALGRCPHCGKGKLFRAYLKPVETCAECGEPLGHIRADDGPAWLTIMVVGHIVVFAALGAAPSGAWPDWLQMTLWPGLALILALTFLPCAKGLFIAMIWATKSEGSERE